MSLQKDLATIEEYNAAMELPYSGLVGIGAYRAQGRSPADRFRAKRELGACVELCRMAELSLTGDIPTARKNASLFAAWGKLATDQTGRDQLRKQLEEIRNSLELMLKVMAGANARNAPGKTKLERIATDLRSLSERIRETIPRDASLSSLIGGSEALPGRRA
jgi:hypothetical protein